MISKTDNERHDSNEENEEMVVGPRFAVRGTHVEKTIYYTVSTNNIMSLAPFYSHSTVFLQLRWLSTSYISDNQSVSGPGSGLIA